MKRGLGVVLLAGVLAIGWISPAWCEGAEFIRVLLGTPHKTYPAPKTYVAPVPGKPPYYGQALGATYYRYGYFGAERHAQCSHRIGYYDEYIEHGCSKGY